MNRPLVSVIVPAFNVEKYIETAIQDLRTQTYDNLECIVVDDGSTDHTLEICKEIAKLDSRIKIISKENGGVSSARNVGLQAATGDWVGFMDPDDRMDPEMFEFLVNASEQRGCDVVACRFVIEYYNEFEITFPHNPNFDVITIEGRNECVSSVQQLINVFLWNKIFRKDLIKEMLFDSELTVLEDAIFVYRAVDRAKCIRVIDVPCYHYRYLFSGLTRKTKTKEYLKSLETIERFIHYCEAEKLECTTDLKKWYLFLSARSLEGLFSIKRAADLELYEQAKINICKYPDEKKCLPFLKRFYVLIAERSFIVYRMCIRFKGRGKRMWLTINKLHTGIPFWK
uniref:Glycosyl transferase n=1 Tax=Eubacterium cellulosolvens (strain ATCC 43171 / JCM 9499 / 6) TaxID=633697 RepID=I5AQ95_EUBC6